MEPRSRERGILSQPAPTPALRGASMEPRSRERGIPHDWCAIHRDQELQWSRAHGSAEFDGPPLWWSKSSPASMEPRSRERGIENVTAVLDHVKWASMEPRSRE